MKRAIILAISLFIVVKVTFGSDSKDNHKEKIGWLGVVPEEMSPAMLAALGIEYGVLVAEVVQNSPAEKLGLRMGDVIISLDGERITESDKLIRAVRERANRTVDLVILRQGQKEKIKAEIGEREKAEIELPLEKIWIPTAGMRKLRQMLRRLEPQLGLGRRMYKETIDSLKIQIEELQQKLKELQKKLEEVKR